MKFFLVMLFLLLLSLWYAFVFEPTNLEVTKHTFILSERPKKSLLLAHVTDIHSDKIGTIEKKLFETLNHEKPDLIVITGDLATPNGQLSGYISILKNFSAPKGVYFAPGNWEYWSPVDDLKNILSQNNIQYLKNKAIPLDEKLWLIGFDDSEEGHPQLSELDKVPEGAKTISLFHSPIFFDRIAGKTALALAGHSHGGQLRIPFFGPLWTPAGTGKYLSGQFEKKGSKLYVSRGIGNSILPMRTFCRPELSMIRIKY